MTTKKDDLKPQGGAASYIQELTQGGKQEMQPDTATKGDERMQETATARMQETAHAKPSTGARKQELPTSVEELQALLMERDARIAKMEQEKRLADRTLAYDREPQEKRVSFSVGESYLKAFDDGAQARGLNRSEFFKRLIIEDEERRERNGQH